MVRHRLDERAPELRVADERGVGKNALLGIADHGDRLLHASVRVQKRELRERSYNAYAARSVRTATSASVPSPCRRVTPEKPTPGVTYSVVLPNAK